MSYGFVESDKKKKDEKAGLEVDLEFFSTALVEAKKQIDFKEIHAVMKLLKWTYNDDNIPSVQTLESTVDYLFNQAMREFILTNEDVSLSTGGFEVVIRDNEELEIVFALKDIIISKDK